MATKPRPVIEFYFSFVSLWSYIGSRRFESLVRDRNVQVIFKPMDLMHVFSVSGGLPVKQRSVQRQAYRLLEMERWRHIRQVPLVFHPKFYPADPSLAHRVFLAAIEELGHDATPVQELARRGLEAVWSEEKDIADPDTIVSLADASGLEGKRLLERASTEAPLAEQEAAITKEAIERDVFGAPFYFLNGEPFWGQDRLEMIDEVIKSKRESIPVQKVTPS
jgi:2-hydroxychromene-2-carboxylate isomerase